MIQVGAGNKLKNIKITYKGRKFNLSPDSDEWILRRVIGELSDRLDNQPICIPMNIPKWSLYSMAVQLSQLVVRQNIYAKQQKQRRYI